MKKLFLLICFSFIAPYLSYGQNAAPDPLRFEEEIEAFTQWDQKNSTPEDPVLFVGSSSIRMWNTAEAFPGLPVVNRGFGGSVISDIQHYYEQVIAPYDPRVVVFYAGDNDVAMGLPNDRVVQNYKDLAGRITQDHPGVKLIYVPIKPSGSRWSDWPAMEQVNRRIEQYNSRHEQLFYVDLATPLLNEEGTPDHSYFLDDQLHLNKKGYAVWNEIMGPMLERVYE